MSQQVPLSLPRCLAVRVRSRVDTQQLRSLTRYPAGRAFRESLVRSGSSCTLFAPGRIRTSPNGEGRASGKEAYLERRLAGEELFRSCRSSRGRARGEGGMNQNLPIGSKRPINTHQTDRLVHRRGRFPALPMARHPSALSSSQVPWRSQLS